MAYTDPPDGASQLFSNAFWNTYVRDNWKALTGVWSTYTPALTSTGTAPVLGTAAVAEGHYLLLNKLCMVRVAIRWGTSGNTFGTGDLIISLPANPQTSASTNTLLGNGLLYDISATTPFDAVAIRGGSSLMKMLSAGVNAAVSSTNVFTMANSDSMQFALRYEVA